MTSYYKFSAKILCIIVLATLLLQCIDRKRDNPFDPDGNSKDILSLSLTPGTDRVTLDWRLLEFLDRFDGFRIYRSVDTQENFQPFVDLATDQFSFTDTNIDQKRWYYYRVVATSNNEETSPSNTARSFLGPGSYWVLETDGFSVKQLSYDLLNVTRTYRTTLAPLEWAFIDTDSLIWLANERFSRSLSSINRDNGNIRYYYPDSVISTRDVEINTETRDIYILDNRDAKILVFRNGSIRNIVYMDPTEDYLKMVYRESDGRLLVLGEKRLWSFNSDALSGASVTIPFPAGMEGKDFDLSGNTMYILAASSEDSQSLIYTVNGSTVTDSLRSANFFYRMRFDAINQHFYLAESLSGNDKIVQLSFNGDRLDHSSGYGDVQQIVINPYDRSVIVVDYFFNLLYLYDQQGNFISESRTLDGNKFILGPTRVYVE